MSVQIDSQPVQQESLEYLSTKELVEGWLKYVNDERETPLARLRAIGKILILMRIKS